MQTAVKPLPNIVKAMFNSFAEREASGVNYEPFNAVNHAGYSTPNRAFAVMLSKRLIHGWMDGQRLAVYRGKDGRWFPVYEK